MTAVVREAMDGFFVWTKKGKAPRFHHLTLVSAMAEAERLAALNPGAKFIVMQAMSKHSVPTTSTGLNRAGEGGESASPAQSLLVSA